MFSDQEDDEPLCSFQEMGLDDRILKAIAKLGWSQPTLIQEKAICLGLEGKDILARARTGSGKTAAYAIPVIQKILKSKQMAREQCTKAIIMAPTKEICHQAHKNIQELSSCCSREVRSIDISGQNSLDSQKPLLLENPDIVIGTPSRILGHVLAGNLNLKKSVEMIVVDEADLVFSFGYEKDMKDLISHFPKIYQAFLMSATLNENMGALKLMILRNPVTLKLEEPQLPTAEHLTHYKIECDEDDDKFLAMYALVKLKLVRGKMIVFVNTVDRCYKLKLFLQQFGIGSFVLNSELPVNCRCHIVGEFNKGLQDIIIAADEVALENPSTIKDEKEKRKTLKRKDKESGISRGIDFQHVTTVLNFDFPPDVDSYIHRVGRTARAGQKGQSLSLIGAKERDRLEQVQQFLESTQSEGFKTFVLEKTVLSNLRYRAETARRSVTRDVIREARREEIRKEMLNSKKLKAYFEDNPRDFQALQHDKPLHAAKIQPELKNMPDYLVPPSLRSNIRSNKRQVGLKWQDKKSRYLGVSKGRIQHRRRQEDPLKSFAMQSKYKGKKRK